VITTKDSRWHIVSEIRNTPILSERLSTFRGVDSAPAWTELPVSYLSEYRESSDSRSVHSNLNEFLCIAAPFDFSKPHYKFPILHTYEDKLLIDKRLEFILELNEIKPQSSILLHGLPKNRYFLADLSDLLICLGYHCIVSIQSTGNFEKNLLNLDIDLIMTCIDIIDATSDYIKPVLRIGTVDEVNLSRINILHDDLIPFFAYSSDGLAFKTLDSHFYLENSPFSQSLLVTLLPQSNLPIFRMDLGIRSRVESNQFHLLGDIK